MKHQHTPRHEKRNGQTDRHGHRIIALAATIRRQKQGEIASDVLGSYTGMAEHRERPEQDADDL
ncbi:MAG: hypothetical protein PUC32_06975 [Oscillospiraceae bacterium]|nr:hypothetical protein [Oscillospiraceae bacterium]